MNVAVGSRGQVLNLARWAEWPLRRALACKIQDLTPLRCVVRCVTPLRCLASPRCVAARALLLAKPRSAEGAADQPSREGTPTCWPDVRVKPGAPPVRWPRASSRPRWPDDAPITYKEWEARICPNHQPKPPAREGGGLCLARVPPGPSGHSFLNLARQSRPPSLAGDLAGGWDKYGFPIFISNGGTDGPSRPRQCPRPALWRGAGLDANFGPACRRSFS